MHGRDVCGTGATAVYLFALIEGAAAPGLALAEAGPLPPPTIHRTGPVAAIVSFVPLADYCSADAALGDVDWVAPRAVQHAAILRRAMQWSAVYPVPFATLFAGLGSLSAFMRAHREALARFFAAVAGMAQWELTANAEFGGREALERIALAARPQWSELPAGARYLMLCRDRAQLIAAGKQRAGAAITPLAERLQPPATAIRRIAPARRNGDGEPIARFALLASSTAAPALAERVQALGAEAAAYGMSLSLSGPWPPFDFRPDLPDLRGKNVMPAQP